MNQTNQINFTQIHTLSRDTPQFMSYIPQEFTQNHNQTKNQLSSLNERNLKLKEDIWRNKQKLLGQGDFNNETVQIRSYSSNNNINITNMNSTYKPSPIIQHPIPNNLIYVTSQKTVQTNQNNMNIDNSQLMRYKSEVERYKILIVQYQRKIQIMSKNEKMYQREIQTYKERINKMNFMLQEREVEKQTIISKFTAQIELINKAKSNEVTQKQCQFCQKLNKKIFELTNHITDLTNQLTLKTKKIKQHQENNKDGTISKLQKEINNLRTVVDQKQVIITQNQTNFNKEYNQVVTQLQKQQFFVQDYKSRMQDYQNHINQLNEYLDNLKSQNSMLKSKGGLESSESNYESEIKFLQEETTNLREHLISAQQRSQVIKKQNASLTRQLSNQKQSFQRTLNELRIQYNRIDSENHNLRLTIQTSRIQYLELNSRYSYVQSEYSNLQHKFKNIKSQSVGISSNEQQNNLKIQNNSLHQQLLKFKTENQRLQKQIKNLNIQMRRAYEALGEIKCKTKAEITDQFLDEKVKAICQERQENYKKQIQTLNFQLQHTKKMISELFTKIQEGGQEQSGSQVQKQISQRYKKHYQQILNKQNNQIDGLNGQIDRLLIDIRNMENGDQIQNYKKQISSKQTHIFELQNKIKNEQSIFKKNESDLYQSKRKQQQVYKNLQHAQSYIQSLQLQIKNIREQSCSNNQKYQLQSKIAELMNKNAILSSEIQRLLSQNRELHITLNKIEEEKMRSSPTKVDKSQWRQLSKTYEELFKQNDSLRHSYSILQKQLTTKNAEMGMLRNQKPLLIEQVTKLKVELQANSSKMQSEYNQQVVVNQKLQITIIQLNHLLAGLKKTTQQQNQRIIQMQTQLSNKESQFDQKYLPQAQQDNDMLDQLTNYQHLISQLTREKQDLTHHLQAAQKYIFDFQQKNYQQIIRQLEHNITILNSERSNLLIRQNQLQKGLHEMNSQRSNADDEQKINAYILQIKRLKERINELQNTIKSLKQLNIEFENKLKSFSTVEGDILAYKHKIQILEKDKQRIISEVNKMNNNIDQHYLPKSQVDPRLQQFVKKNHQIIEELQHAKIYITQLQQKCQIYIKKSYTSSSYQTKTIQIGQTGTYPLDSMQHTSTNSFGQNDNKKIDELQLIISKLTSQKEALLTKVKQIQSQKYNLETNYKESTRKLQSQNAIILNQEKQNTSKIIQEYEVKIKRIYEESRISSSNASQIQVLTQKNRKLENDKAVISSQLQRLSQIISNLNAQKLNYQKQLQEQKNKLQKIQNQHRFSLEKVSNQQILVIQRLQTQNTRLSQQQKVNSSLVHDQNLNAEIKHMQNVIRQKNEQIQNILFHLKQAEAYIVANQPQFLSWQNEKQQILSTLRQYQSKIHALQVQNQALRTKPTSVSANDQSLKIIEVLKSQNSQFSTKNQELQANHRSVNIKLQNLRSQQNQWKVQQNSWRSQQTKWRIQQNKWRIQQTKWFNQRQFLDQIKASNQKLLSQRQQIDTILNNLRNQNKILQQNNSQLIIQNKNISQRINSTSSNDQRVKVERSIMASQIQRLSNQLLKYKQEKDQLQKDYSTLRSQNSQLKTKNQQITNIRQQNKKLITEINVFKSQKTINFDSNRTNTELQIQELNRQKLQILDKLKQAEDYIFKLEEETQSLTKPNIQNSIVLEKELGQVRLQKEEILRKLLQSENMLKDYEQIIKQQKQDGENNTTLQNTIKTLQQENRNFHVKLQKADSLIEQYQKQIKQKNQAISQALTKFQTQIKELKNQRQELKNKLKQAEEQILNLQSKEEKPDLGPKVAQLQEQNKTIGGKLKQAQEYIIYMQENNEAIIGKIIQPIKLQIEQFKSEKQVYTRKLIEAQQQIIKLQIVSKQTSDQSEYILRIQELEQQNKGILQKLHEAQKYISERQQIILQRQSTIKNLQAQNQRSKQENQQNLEKLLQAEEYIEKCERHKDQISEKLAISQLNIKQLYQHYSVKEGDDHEDDHKIAIEDTYNKNVETLQTLQNSRLKISQKNLQSSIVTRLTEQNIGFKKQMNHVNEELAKAQETSKKLNEQIDRLGHIISKFQLQNSQLATQKAILSSQVQRLASQNNKTSNVSTSQVQKLKEQITTLSNMNQSLKKQQVSLYSAIAQNDIVVKEAQGLRHQNDELMESSVHADAHIMKLQIQKRQNTKFTQQLQNKNKLLQTQIKLAQTQISQLKQNIKSTQFRINSQLQSSIQQSHKVKSQFDDLIDQKARLAKERTFFEEKLFAAQQYILQVEKQKQALAMKIQQLKNQIDTLKSLRNTSLDQSSVQLSKSKHQKQTLQKQLHETSQNTKLMSSEIANLKQSLTQTEQNITIHKNQITQHERTIIQLQKEINSQRQVQQELKTVIDELSKPIQDQRVGQLIQQNNQLKNGNNVLRTQVDEKHKIQSKLKEAEQFIKKLQGEIAKQDQNILKTQETLIQTESRLTTIETQYSQQKDKVKNISEELTKNNSYIGQINNKNAHLQQLVQAKHEKEKTYENEISQLKIKLSQLEEKLQKQIDEYHRFTQQQYNSKDQIISNLSVSQAETQKALSQKQSQIENLNNLLNYKQESIDQQNKAWEKKYKQLNAEYDQTRNKLSESNQELLRINPLLQQIQWQKENAQNQLKDALKTVKQQKLQIQAITSKLMEAEQFIQHLQSQVAKASNPILKDSINSNSSQQQIKGIESMGEISNMSVDLKELQSKLIAKEQELTNSNQELIMIRQKLNSLQNRINEDDSIDNSHQITLLNDRLKQNQEELLQQKIRNQNLVEINEQLEGQNENLRKQFEALASQMDQVKQASKYFELRMMEAEQISKKFGSQTKIQKSSSDQNLQKIQNQLQVPKDDGVNKSQQSVGSEDRERQEQYLRLKLLEKQQLIDKLNQTIQNLSEELGKKFTDEQNNSMMEAQKTKQLDDEIKKLKEKLDTTQVYVKQLQLIRDESSQQGSKSSKSSTQRLANEQQKQKQGQSDANKDNRLVQKLINYINQYDSLDIFREQNIQKQLNESNLFAKLFETIKMRLRLLNALDIEKQTKIQRKNEQIQQLNQTVLKLKQKIQDLSVRASESEVIQSRYEEVLGEVIEYERLNKNLEDQVNSLNNQLSIHKSQLDQFSKQIQNNSSSLSSQLSPRQVPINDEQLKDENHQLRRKLQDAQYELLSIKSSVEGYMNGELVVSPKRKDESFNFQLFLRQCLDNIQNIENNISEVQIQMNQNRQSFERLINILKSSDRLGSKRSDQSNIVQKLQDLQQKLLLNDKRLKQHQEQSQVQIINLMKQALSNSENQINRTKIEDYLNQLEYNIFKNNEQHQQQIKKIKEHYENIQQNKGKSPRTYRQVSSLKSQEKSDRLQKSQNRRQEQGQTEQDRKNFDNEDLLRQINGLTNHIGIYHQQAARMKDKFRKTIEGLVREIQQMKQAYDKFDKQNPTVKQTHPQLNSKVNQIMDKAHSILQNDVKQADEKSDYYADDDYIMTNNYVQYIKSKEEPQQQKQFLHNLKSIADQFQNKESSSLPNLSQNPNILNFSNNDIMSKPFLEYIMNNRDLDKEEVNLLKKKINQMKAKEVKDNLNYLKQNENKLQELMKKKNQIFANQNVLPNTQFRDLLFNTMANNFSKDQISQIFGSQDNDELLNKLNEVLGMDGQPSSYIKNQNSSEMMKQIQIIKNRYYREPSQLSEQVYKHLIKLLSAKDDTQFYMLIDSLFKLLFELQDEYEKTIAQKDELYRVHTQKMNKIFNRSSSDQSEDYRTLLVQDEAFNVAKEERVHYSGTKIQNQMQELGEEIQKANNEINKQI